MHYLLFALFAFTSLNALPRPVSDDMQKIMHQSRYEHSTWGLYAKDLTSGQVLYEMNANQMFLPASTTKLFSVAALLDAYGKDYRFKTPVYAVGTVENGKLTGSLVMVAQGDLIFGGRQEDSGHVAYTKMDHNIANNVPGVLLTPQDPLKAFQALAQDIRKQGIQEIHGDIFIDDSLFATTEKRGMQISPMMVNENLIDFTINPSTQGKPALISWRPQVSGYAMTNEVETVAKDGETTISVTSSDDGIHFIVKGTIAEGQKNIVRTYSISEPGLFAKAAFIEALKNAGITVSLDSQSPIKVPEGQSPIAVWVSPPLSEYAKLILKVSHNIGANMIPLLLAAKRGKTDYDEGMADLGKFVHSKVKIPYNAFVFIDGAGGDENRLTPKAEVDLLEYMKKLPPPEFQSYYDALPIFGVDGSLEDFGKETAAVGKIRAKTGTGVTYNLAAQQLFLTTQALAGYIEGKNGNLIAFMLAVNNGDTPQIEDIFPVFEDLSQISAIIYEHSDQ